MATPSFKDYYATLGVSRTASEKEIKSAYRKLARQYHPDVNKDPGADDRFKLINEAYSVLSDPAKRTKYDGLGADWERIEREQEFARQPAHYPDRGSRDLSYLWWHRLQGRAAGAPRPDRHDQRRLPDLRRNRRPSDAPDAAGDDSRRGHGGIAHPRPWRRRAGRRARRPLSARPPAARRPLRCQGSRSLHHAARARRPGSAGRRGDRPRADWQPEAACARGQPGGEGLPPA